MIPPGQGGYESLEELAARLMPDPSSHLTRASKRAGEEVTDSAPKRQKLHIEREKLNRIAKTKMLKVPSKKGLAGFEYICRTCEKHFKKRLRCLAHARDCGQGSLGKGRKRKKSLRKSQCNMCNFEATTRLRLKAHRQAEHGGMLRKHRCTRCYAQFASSKSFVRHVRRHASRVAFPCPTIGSGLPMKLQFKDLVGSTVCPFILFQCFVVSVATVHLLDLQRVKSRNTEDGRVGYNQ